MIQKVVMGTQIPAKLWLNQVEDPCMAQIITLASLPYAFKHIAIMPDAHTGKGMPIGGVLATKGVVIPNAVGVDIGCGMCAIKSNLFAKDLTREDLTAILSYVKSMIPIGFEHREEPVDESELPDIDLETLPYLKNKKAEILKQIGTLGGGNHFIEIQKDTSSGYVWVMIHSGSRKIGYKVSEHYNKLAEFWCQKWYANAYPNLAFLPIETQEAKDYMREMAYCKEMAHTNRRVMMNYVIEAFKVIRPEVEFDPMINVAHNYAAWEEHFGEMVIVHRKGATRARKGEIGIIPGSMGTHSYIVEGLGNPESFMSCSHGAGRKLSRTSAIRSLSVEVERKEMDSKGIIHTLTDENSLDEAPGAYKDIEEVMAFQSDLVKPLIKLAPLAVIKG